MRKEKLRKVELCFITGCFIKPPNFASLFTAQFLLFDIRTMQEI